MGISPISDSEGLSKLPRLHHICHLLYRNPNGLTATQLAKFCGVNKRTIQRDIRDLEDESVPIWEDAGQPPCYGIGEGYYLPPVHLTLDDALALFLAARLLARYADTFDPHIIQALAKLAHILPEGIAAHVHATIRAMDGRQGNPDLVAVLRTLAIGWSERRVVRILYRSAERSEARECLLSPYYIEPSATGNATYVIGHASHVDALRTFKVERIVSATLTKETFEVPETFDGPGLLAGAWSIWYGEEPQEVTLRFVPEATRRVKETYWHPSQTLEEQPDGGCVLRLMIAEPTEMIHWIRGWGPQVEVVEPEWLREQMGREAREVVKKYEERG